MELRAQDSDTIYALATAAGKSGIAVVRTSGPRAWELARALAPSLPLKGESHRAYFRTLVNQQDQIIDQAVLTYFENGRSFTGEDVVEFSLHGNPVLVSRLSRELHRLGARQAERGEFTYRAYLNGQIDLVQAESVLALIESESEEMARLSLGQLQGGLSEQIESVAEAGVGLAAQIEAGIDYAQEGIELISNSEVLQKLEKICGRLTELSSGYQQSKTLRDGFSVVFCGEPNVGKSSLFNRILQQQRSLVAPTPGTTRDYVDALLEIDGHKIRLVDTAGLRESTDEIESKGVEKTKEWLNQANLVVQISTPGGAKTELISSAPRLNVENKSDLCPQDSTSALRVSALTGAGVKELIDRILLNVKEQNQDLAGVVLNARQYEQMNRALLAFNRAKEMARQENQSIDLVALEIREGVRILNEILGVVFDEQIIDRVFRDFCIGK